MIYCIFRAAIVHHKKDEQKQPITGVQAAERDDAGRACAARGRRTDHHKRRGNGPARDRSPRGDQDRKSASHDVGSDFRRGLKRFSEDTKICT